MSISCHVEKNKTIPWLNKLNFWTNKVLMTDKTLTLSTVVLKSALTITLIQPLQCHLTHSTHITVLSSCIIKADHILINMHFDDSASSQTKVAPSPCGPTWCASNWDKHSYCTSKLSLGKDVSSTRINGGDLWPLPIHHGDRQGRARR